MTPSWDPQRIGSFGMAHIKQDMGGPATPVPPGGSFDVTLHEGR